MKRSQGMFVEQWRRTGKLNAHIEETFTGHALVKVFGRQREVERTFAEENDELYEASFGAQFVSGLIMPAMMFIGNLNYVVIAVVGGLRVANGSMSLGDVQAFIQYSRQFTQPLTQVASMANLLQSGVASAERVFELLDAEEQSAERGRRARGAGGDRHGEVRFEHVSFSYDPDVPLIEDLSLVAAPGQTVAIVGPTGAGKTTLVNLVMRFYEVSRRPDHARRRRHRRRCRAASCAARSAWCCRTPGCSAARSATTSPTVGPAPPRRRSSRPRGRRTSTGSCTRCPTATTPSSTRRAPTSPRASASWSRSRGRSCPTPTLLILDEATSSVDTRTELLLQHAMAALRTDRTSFVIAHRLSTIRDADLILVMEDGAIVEQGTHDDAAGRRRGLRPALQRPVRGRARLIRRAVLRGRRVGPGPAAGPGPVAWLAVSSRRCGRRAPHGVRRRDATPRFTLPGPRPSAVPNPARPRSTVRRSAAGPGSALNPLSAEPVALTVDPHGKGGGPNNEFFEDA